MDAGPGAPPPRVPNAHSDRLARAFADRTGAFPQWDAWGLRWVDHAPGRTVLEADLDSRHHNPVGVVHGGVLFQILDTAMGFASQSVLDEPDLVTATIQLSISYVRPVAAGRVRAEGRVVRQGRRVLHMEGTLTDTSGELVARASGAWAVVAEKPRAPAP